MPTCLPVRCGSRAGGGSFRVLDKFLALKPGEVLWMQQAKAEPSPMQTGACLFLLSRPSLKRWWQDVLHRGMNTTMYGDAMPRVPWCLHSPPPAQTLVPGQPRAKCSLLQSRMARCPGCCGRAPRGAGGCRSLRPGDQALAVSLPGLSLHPSDFARSQCGACQPVSSGSNWCASRVSSTASVLGEYAGVWGGYRCVPVASCSKRRGAEKTCLLVVWHRC